MPRSRKTTRGIVLVAFVAAAGVLVAACTPPLPPDVLAAKAENQITCQSGELTVSVPEDFVGSMDAVGQALAGVCPEQKVTETVNQADAPLRLVDRAPSTEEVADFTKTACTTGDVIVVPAFAYAVALAYNVIGLEGLVLTPQAVAGILDGTVTSWEDPLIADANADYDLSGLPDISVLGVEHDQGSVEAMTAWLTKEDPQAWPAGVVGILPSAQAYPTQADALNDLIANEGAVSVMPAFSAIANGIAVASVPVQDTVVSPDDTQLLKVGAGATTLTVAENGSISASPAIGGVPVDGNFDLAASKVVLADGQKLLGWPIMGMAHLLICDAPSDPLPLSTAQYVLRLAGQGALETFGVTPLPEPIRLKTFTPLKVKVNLDEADSSTSPTPADGGSAAASDASSDAPSTTSGDGTEPSAESS
ncbi:MAG: substrate-binding domain-containing protein [Candidatus Nanopelagicales bacterium]|jgi:phosphate transport system substrate-binding protein